MAKGLRLQAKLQWDSQAQLLDILLYPPLVGDLVSESKWLKFNSGKYNGR